jgi:UDP-N-acetylmuramate--alanine ligase
VGIGGSGMSGLAAMLAKRGARCRGEDAATGPALADLAAAGIPVEIADSPASPEGRLRDADAVIVSAAVPPDHPTLREAVRRGLPLLAYAEALGLLERDSTAVCVAGTHGKSTTTSLLGHALAESGLDPSVVVGARSPSFGGGCRVGAAAIPSGPLQGRPGILVAEACEYRRSFLAHHPTLALVNNIEADHLDAYRDLGEIVEAFAAFVARLPSRAGGGYLLVAHEGAFRETLAASTAAEVESFGPSPDATWQVRIGDGGIARLHREGREVASWRTPLPGRHSAMNAAAAAILAHRLGAAWPSIAAAVERFPGLDRRMQLLGRRRVPGGEVRVIDDYGHHPTECRVTLEAIREHHRPRRLICVFQPHQHSRTRHLLDAFAESFDAADLVLVPEIHFVRDHESERARVSSADLVDRLNARGTPARHAPCLSQLLGTLEATCGDGDLLVVMGAGPIDALGHAFLAAGKDA